jgi:hypothetical protein
MSSFYYLYIFNELFSFVNHIENGIAGLSILFHVDWIGWLI